MKGRWRLSSSERLRDPVRIAQVRQHGHHYTGRWVHCYVAPNRLPLSRVNVVILSAPSSVVRHRFRRRLLEVYRTHKQFVKKGFDIVVQLQVNKYKYVTYDQLKDDLLHLLGLAAVNALDEKLAS